MKRLLILALVCSAFAGQHFGSAKDDKVDAPLWVPVRVVTDSIAVEWVNEFGMSNHITCSGMWYNATAREYLLTWKSGARLILEANNINELSLGPAK